MQANSSIAGGNLDSKNTQQFRQWLVRHRFAKDVSIIDGAAEDDVMVFIPASYLGPKVSANKTSTRQLAHLKRIAARELGLRVDFRITADEGIAEIESGVTALVRNTLQSSDVKVFLSVSLDRHADLWFDAIPMSITEKVTKDVRNTVKDYLEKVGLTLHEIYLHGASVPSIAMVLRSVKILQPTTAEAVAKYLTNQGFSRVPIRWVKSQLDRLRKKDFITWSNETYSITYAGLSSLPISKGRSSSDIERALALGKRRW